MYLSCGSHFGHPSGTESSQLIFAEFRAKLVEFLLGAVMFVFTFQIYTYTFCLITTCINYLLSGIVYCVVLNTASTKFSTIRHD